MKRFKGMCKDSEVETTIYENGLEMFNDLYNEYCIDDNIYSKDMAGLIYHLSNLLETNEIIIQNVENSKEIIFVQTF